MLFVYNLHSSVMRCGGTVLFC